MANNKNFKIKNSIEATKFTDFNGTIATAANGPDGLFSTTLYTGTGSSNAVSTGVDLSSSEGMVFIKNRTGTSDWNLFDTVRGMTTSNAEILYPNKTDAEVGIADYFNVTSTGFTALHSGMDTNDVSNNSTYVAFSFKSAANFFDVVTYSGSNSQQTINHNLGSAPGMVIVKCRSASGTDWYVYHNALTSSSHGMVWNSTGSEGGNGYWPVAPTSSQFTLKANTGAINQSGRTYVAYFFGHDTSSSSMIQCGGYTGNGSAAGPDVTLGWEPQWVMIKNRDLGSEQWHILDNVRGVATGGTDSHVRVNQTGAEISSQDILEITSTGFRPMTSDDKTNGSGHPYIYVAIRKVEPKQTLDLSTGNRFSFTATAATEVVFSNPPATGAPAGFSLEVENSSAYALTWPSSIKWHGGSAPSVNAGKAVYAFITTDGGTTYFGKLAGEGIA